MGAETTVERAKRATRDAYGEAIVEVGRRMPQVLAMTGDLRDSNRLEAFAQALPERFIECGIAEQNMAGVAAGLATCGKIPFVSSFASFSPGRNFDQIHVLIAQPRLNVKLVSTHGGITIGEDGMSAQALEDFALARALANMTVICPADAAETRQVIWAVAEYVGPVYVRLGRMAVPAIYGDDYRFEIGRASVLREGTDLTIIACGVMVAESLEAADLLAREGTSARVLNLSTIKPVDVEAVVAAARATGAIVTAEEHNVLAGMGGAVAEVVLDHHPVPMERVGVRDVFGQSASPRELMEAYGLTAREVAEAARRVVRRKTR